MRWRPKASRNTTLAFASPSSLIAPAWQRSGACRCSRSAQQKTAWPFLQQLRQERLRQASTSFNAALIILTVGTLIVLAGAILLFTQRVKTGTLTAAAGVIANITSGLVFRFSHNANDRLDKLARGIGKLEGTKRTIRLLEAQTERHRSREVSQPLT